MSLADAQDSVAGYMPARMLNEFVYCPRLFYYEHVEGVFAHNRETVEGSIRHARVDTGDGALPPVDALTADDVLHARSVTLASDRAGLIAKLDVIEVGDGSVVPVDYKRGAPRTAADGSLEVWDADKAQMAAQAIVLRDNGYTCNEAVLYYATTKQRVRIPIDDATIDWALDRLRGAREASASSVIPPPLEDSPKCPRCSLVGICLPDETRAVHAIDARHAAAPDAATETEAQIRAQPADVLREQEVRRLLPARDDLRPLYLNTPGLRVGKSGQVLRIQEKDRVVEEVRIGEICQVNLFGNIQLTTQAVQTLCELDVPIAYFSMGGWFYGLTRGLGERNVSLRRGQFRLADDPRFCLTIARALVVGKIRNQRTLLQRNHVEPPAAVLGQMKWAIEEAERAPTLEELLGIEGFGAKLYFGNFAGMVKPDDEPWSENRGRPLLSFDFTTRNRRPPRDPVNALLSLAYSMLAKDLTIVCHAVGFDPFIGYYHQPRFGRAPLALDLMEPFRPLIADSAVLTAINTRMIRPEDFVKAGDAVALTTAGRKAFFRAYEQRMDALVTHPLFGYRVSYRRMLEVQARLLGRVVTGELTTYPVFTTR
jgi:CRISPR-associated protein Cas1